MSYTLSRGNADRENVNEYNGILHRLPFQVDKPILLTGVSFLGLPKNYKGYSEMFIISLVVRESVINSHIELDDLQIFMPETQFVAEFKKEIPYKLELSPPVLIPSDVWIEIGYELNGPATQVLEESCIHTTSLYSSEYAAKFEFTGQNTKQISELQFMLPSKAPKDD